MTRIQLISGPRNISTALMYSFGNRPDCNIVDEPYYAHYLYNNPSIDHPGKAEVIESQAIDESLVLEQLLTPRDLPILFIKNMAHHLAALSPETCLAFKNIFLIRDTAKILSSFSKVVTNPELKDIGIKQEWALYEFLKSQGREPVVLDSGILLDHPESVLRKLCEALNIPFKKEMLQWETGPRKEDGVWAKYWYKNVHTTRAFKKQNSSSDPLPDHLTEVNAEADYYYQKLFTQALRP